MSGALAGDAQTTPQAVDRLALDLARTDEGSIRIVVEQLALAAAAAELYRIGAGRLADAFCETRLAGQWRSSYGMLDSRFDAANLLEALYPPDN